MTNNSDSAFAYRKDSIGRRQSSVPNPFVAARNSVEKENGGKNKAWVGTDQTNADPLLEYTDCAEYGDVFD